MRVSVNGMSPLMRKSLFGHIWAIGEVVGQCEKEVGFPTSKTQYRW
jgi:hypothetical protein